MAVSAPVRDLAKQQRRNLRGLIVMVVVTFITAVILVLHRAWMQPFDQGVDDLLWLLRDLLLALLFIIPIAGIYSLVNQFAFWEGWLAGIPEPSEVLAGPSSKSQAGVRRFVIYLDGIHQLERDHPPRVSTFLEELQSRLQQDHHLVRGLETYTVLQVGLADDHGSAWFWRRLFALQEHHPNALIALLASVLVQANNVIKVGISSDRRYGPILNYELALKITLRLVEEGFDPAQGSELVLLGYSGGGEMAMGVADYLRRICGVPVQIITFCGVFSGNQWLLDLERVTLILGSVDPVAALGQIAYPGRLALLPFTKWNQARRRGLVQRSMIHGMTHNGSRGPFSECYRSQVIGRILQVLDQQQRT